MVDNVIEATADSVAAFSVGPVEPNGFYLSLIDFRHAQPLPGAEAIRIVYPGYAIQVDRLT